MTLDVFHEMSAEGIRPLNGEELERLQHSFHERQFDLAIDLRRRPETRKYLKMSGARYTVAYDAGEDGEWLSIV